MLELRYPVLAIDHDPIMVWVYKSEDELTQWARKDSMVGWRLIDMTGRSTVVESMTRLGWSEPLRASHIFLFGARRRRVELELADKGTLTWEEVQAILLQTFSTSRFWDEGLLSRAKRMVTKATRLPEFIRKYQRMMGD